MLDVNVVKHEVVVLVDNSIDIIYADPKLYILMKYNKKENKAATKTINNAGGDGNHLSIEAPKLSATPTKIAVAVPMLSVL